MTPEEMAKAADQAEQDQMTREKMARPLFELEEAGDQLQWAQYHLLEAIEDIEDYDTSSRALLALGVLVGMAIK
jgi:hypothetical protein